MPDSTAQTAGSIAQTTDSTSSTAGLATYEACDKVLDTAELLEAIILCLPAIKIFGVRRVSKTWLAAILASKNIQRKAFLLPIPVEEQWVFRATADPPAINQDRRPRKNAAASGSPPDNELIVAPRGELDDGRFEMNGVLKEFASGPITPATLCPLMKPPDSSLDVARRSWGVDGRDEVYLPGREFMSRAGSWQATLLSNPPCKAAYLSAELIADVDPPKTIDAGLWFESSFPLYTRRCSMPRWNTSWTG